MFFFVLKCQKTHSRMVNYFKDSFPYYCTQSSQSLFITLSKEKPLTVQKEFRIRLCSFFVFFFTGIIPLDSQLMSKLGLYYSSPPEYDVPDIQSNDDIDSEENTCGLIPVEDLSTLIDKSEKRKKPVAKIFRVAGLSPVFSAAVKRGLLPNEKDAKIEIESPPNGEKDWTTNLPDLLPDVSIYNNRKLTRENYDPMKEPRSIIHRSRRPFTVAEYQRKKTKFINDNKKLDPCTLR